MAGQTEEAEYDLAISGEDELALAEAHMLLHSCHQPLQASVLHCFWCVAHHLWLVKFDALCAPHNKFELLLQVLTEVIAAKDNVEADNVNNCLTSSSSCQDAASSSDSLLHTISCQACTAQGSSVSESYASRATSGSTCQVCCFKPRQLFLHQQHAFGWSSKSRLSLKQHPPSDTTTNDSTDSNNFAKRRRMSTLDTFEALLRPCDLTQRPDVRCLKCTLCASRRCIHALWKV